MCGLVAAFGNLNGTSKKIFEQLLQVDVIRGKHSTGVFGDGGATYKKALSATEFLELSKAKSIISDSTSMLVGHNRHATVGAVNDVNAHPFTHGNITLVHNGTLTDQDLLPDSKDFLVDSENICHAVNKLGAKAAFERTEGAYACIWYDSEADTLSVVRNTERPLWYVQVQGGPMYIGSEREMLLWILMKNKITFTGDYKDYFIEVPECEIITFKKQGTKVKEVSRTPFDEALSWKAWGRYDGYGAYQGNVSTIKTVPPIEKHLGLRVKDKVDVLVEASSFKSYSVNNPKSYGSAMGRMQGYPYNRCKVYNLPDIEEDTVFEVEIGALDLYNINKGINPEVSPQKLIVSCYNPVKKVQVEHTCINCGASITEHLAQSTDVREVDGELVCQNCWDNDSTVIDLFPVMEPITIIKSLKDLEVV